MNGVGHIEEAAGTIIYAGKKNEVLSIDSLDANKAINNTRQIIGRIPGLNIIETEASGFTANGIGFRGLNPYQSILMNTRQNGYNISADVFGYNEAYYLPPMEAVHSIQFVRGAAGLQFGPQIGGVVNYILKDAPADPFAADISLTAGSYGMYNAYGSMGGTKRKWSYNGFLQYRHMDGYLPNSRQNQLSGFAKLGYDVSPRLKLSLEYTALRNRIQMPGGLTDLQFAENPCQSNRTRNWLESPWNILAANVAWKISDNTSLELKSAYMFSQRNLVWRNEDGWPDQADSLTPSGTYVPRELEREYFNSVSNELRILHKYRLGNNSRKHTLALGIRQATSKLIRKEGAEGTTGQDFDLTAQSDYQTDLAFRTNNIAFFAENIFHVGSKFSITPGFRFEYLNTSMNGYTENEDTTSQNEPLVYAKDEHSSRSFLLAGIGLQYAITSKVAAYGNLSQSYRPITYSDLSPFGTISRVDASLKDSKTLNGDAGVRGTIRNMFNFDVSAFYLAYENRIGLVAATDNSGNQYTLRTNTGSSLHTGIETYAELSLSHLIAPGGKWGKLSVYNSYAFVDAHYNSGEFNGKEVEYAPRHVERLGLNYSIKGFSVNAQYSMQSRAFATASNASFSADALEGEIPAFSVIDVSASYKWKRYTLHFGLNNLADTKYFTLRTDEYPGPGIIPAVGRMIYSGISARL